MKSKILMGTVALSAILLFSSFVPATQYRMYRFLQRSPETRANLITAMIKNRLSLNDSQAETAYRINLKYARLCQPYIERKDTTMQAREELAQINQKRRHEIMAILSPEQVDQAESLRQQQIKRLEWMLGRLKKNGTAVQ